MKKYHYRSELEKRQQTQQQLDELLFFQEMLRTCEPMNERFCGKAEEIAAGLQPWIDVLEDLAEKLNSTQRAVGLAVLCFSPIDWIKS